MAKWVKVKEAWPLANKLAYPVLFFVVAIALIIIIISLSQPLVEISYFELKPKGKIAGQAVNGVRPEICSGWTGAAHATTTDLLGSSSLENFSDDNSATFFNQPGSQEVNGQVSSDQTDLECSGFILTDNIPKEVETLTGTVTISFGAKGYPASEDIVVFAYSLDKGNTWQSLDSFALLSDMSNNTNSGYWMYEIPDLIDIADPDALIIRVQYIQEPASQLTKAFIDGISLDVEYTTKPVVDLDLEKIVKVKKRDVKVEEEPEIMVEMKEGRTIKSVALDTPDGTVIEPAYDVATEEEKGKTIKVHKIKKESFKNPGIYRVVFTIEEQGVEEQVIEEFFWGVLVLNTPKSVYRPGETVHFGMGVLNAGGHTVCDASLSLKIQDPDGEQTIFSTEDGTITKSPQCGPKTVTNLPDYAADFVANKRGEYPIELTATTKSGTYIITDTLYVQEDILFDITRLGPTRIWPIASYQMFLEVVPKEDYTGQFEELVPVNFIISGVNEDGSVYEVDSNNKAVRWLVNWQAGQAYTLSYTFDAPDVSPAIFRLGPATIGDFSELRQWQIASDAINWNACRTEQGTTTIAASQGSYDLTLDTSITDTSQAYLIVDSSGTSGVQGGDHHMVSGYILDADTLRFERGLQIATAAQVSYALVECFNNEFDVQRGEITISAGSASNSYGSLSSVDTDQSMVIVSSRTADTGNAQDEALVTGELTDSTTVFVERAVSVSTSATYVRYEVVEWDTSVNVHTNEVSLGFSQASVTDSLPDSESVTMNRAWAYCSWDSGYNGLRQSAVGCQLTSTTQMTFYRYAASPYMNRIRYYVIEFPADGVTVQRGNEAIFTGQFCFEGSQCDHDITITDVGSLTKAFAFGTNTTSGTGTAFPRNKWIQSLSSTTNLRASNWRSYNTSSADDNYKYWQVVVFPMGIDVSGNAYNENTTNALTECDGSTDMVSLYIGSTQYDTTCADSDGAFTFADVTEPSTGDAMIVWIEGQTPDGAAVNTYSGSGDVTGVVVEENALTIKNDDTGGITNTDLDTYDNNNDDDINYTVSFGGLATEDGHRIIVQSNESYVPGGTIYTSDSSSASSMDGDIYLETGATLDMGSNTLAVGGDFTSAGNITLTLDSGQDTVFLATASGHAIEAEDAWEDLYFVGTGGGWDFDAAATINGDVTITTGTLSGTDDIAIAGGDITGAGTINMSGGTVTLTGTGNINGGTYTFNNLTIGTATAASITAQSGFTVSGTLDVDTSDQLSIDSGQTVTHSGSTLTLDGTITGAGRLTYQSETAFPTTGTISSILRFDVSNNYQTMGARTYGGTVEIYNNGAANYYVGMGTAGGQTINLSSNLYLEAVSTGGAYLLGLQNATVNIAGDLDFLGGGGAESIYAGTATWTVSGSADFTGGVFSVPPGNTFVMDGTGTLTSASEEFYHLTLSGTITLANETHIVDGNLSMAGGTITAGSSTVSMEGTANTITGGDATLNNLTIDPSSAGTITLQTSDLTVSGTINVAAGDELAISSGITLTHTGSTFTWGDGSSTVSGDGTLRFTNVSGGPGSGGTLSSVVRYDASAGDVDENIFDIRTYYNRVEIYCDNTASSNRSVTPDDGIYTMTGASSHLYIINDSDSYTLTLDGSNSPTINVGGDLDFTGTGASSEIITSGTGTWTVSGNVNFTDGTYTATSGNTLKMDGTGNLIGNGQSLHHLTIDGNGNTVTAATSDVSVAGTLTIGGAADSNDDTLSIDSGRTVTSGTGGTVTLVGSGTDSITGDGTLRVQNSNLGADGTISADVEYYDTTVTATARDYGGDLRMLTVSSIQITFDSGTFNVSGNLTIDASSTGNLTANSGANNPVVNVTGDLDFVGTGDGSEALIIGTDTWTVSGNVDFTDGSLLIVSGNTFQMNGSSKTITSYGEAFDNFSITGGSVSTTDDFEAVGDFTISAGASFTQDDDTDITLTGDTILIADTGSFTKSSTGKLILDGVSDNQTFEDANTSKQDLGHVQIGQSPGTTKLKSDFAATDLTILDGDTFETHGWEVDLSDFLDCQGACVLDLADDAPDNEGDGTIVTFGGNWTMSAAGTFTVSTDSQVEPDGTADQTITTGDLAFYHFYVNNSGDPNDDVIISGTLDVNGNLTVNDGELEMSTNNPDIYTSRNVTFNPGVTATKGTGTWTFDGNAIASTYTDSTAVAQNIGVVVTNKTSGVPAKDKVTLASDMTVDTVSIGTADTLDLMDSGYILTLANIGATANVLTYNGSLDAGTDSLIKYSATNSGGNINVAAAPYHDIQFSGAETYQLAGNLTSTDDIDGNLTIDSGATLDASGSNYGIDLAGNWTNNGDFTDQAGTITLDGASQQTLSGQMTSDLDRFYDLTITNASASDPDVIFAASANVANNFTAITASSQIQFAAGETYHFQNISFNGQDPTTRVELRSSSDDTEWYLESAGTRSVYNTDVKDSYACDQPPDIDATDISNKNSEGNNCWDFDVITFTISSNAISLGSLSTGSVSTDSHTIRTDTSAQSGYVSFIYDNGNLTDGSNDIDDVGDGAVTAGSEEYGIATSDNGRTITEDDTCDGSSASALTTSQQDVAGESSGPADETITICYAASIASTTIAGAYSHTVYVVTTGLF